MKTDGTTTVPSEDEWIGVVVHVANALPGAYMVASCEAKDGILRLAIVRKDDVRRSDAKKRRAFEFERSAE